MTSDGLCLAPEDELRFSQRSVRFASTRLKLELDCIEIKGVYEGAQDRVYMRDMSRIVRPDGVV